MAKDVQENIYSELPLTSIRDIHNQDQTLMQVSWHAGSFSINNIELYILTISE